MDTAGLEQLTDTLRSLGKDDGDRATKAQRAVDLVRQSGLLSMGGVVRRSPWRDRDDRMVWAPGSNDPRFPVDKGLNGACVSSRKPVIVQDVARDPRYLTTIGGTRGEMIQPVFDESGAVIGTIDVESDRVNAFSSRFQ